MNGIFLFLAVTFGVSGCAWTFKSARVTALERRVEELEARLREREARLEESEEARDQFAEQIRRLQGELSRVQEERTREVRRLMEEKERAAAEAARRAAEAKEREAQDLVEAQRRLAESLKQELGEARAKLAMTERGLVLTFLDEVFFDSGKAVVKPEGLETLAKVGQVLKETVPDSPVAVEGHTDNEQIRYSGWRSNWELSSARALAVVHRFIEGQGIAPERLRAAGYGEYHPVAPNDTAEGRRQNRRVEVVILPSQLRKVRE